MARPQSTFHQRSPMLSLAFIALWCILVAISDGAVVTDFVDCSKCNCGDLPKVASLDGRVVDVHASTTGDDWFTLNETSVSNQTQGLFLRSVDAACKVEIKFKFINATKGDIVMYPGGRIDPTATVLDMGPGEVYCKNDQSVDPSVLLGTSVISTQQELAIAKVPKWTWNALFPQAVIDFQLLYRQHCTETKAQVGYVLPPPSVNGSTQTVRLVNPNGASLPGTYSTIITWTITPPTPNCAIALTFSRSTNNTIVAVNELDRVLLGITHRVPQGVEAIIQVRKWILSTVDAAVTVEYHAVDCGSSPLNHTAIQIASWNNVVKPLKRLDVPAGLDPWQVVNFSFPDDGTQQIAVWYLEGPNPAYVGYTSWTDAWSEEIPNLYQNDFNTRFNNNILPGTGPLTLIRWLNTGQSTTFGYAFLPIAAPPIFVATARNSTYQTLSFTQDMITARRVYIKAANLSCSVQIRRGMWYAVGAIHILPYGFTEIGPNDILDNAFDDDDYTSNDTSGIGMSLRRRPIRSIGSEIGIQFLRWIDVGPRPSILYRMVCPVRLEAATTTNEWQYVSAITGTSYLLPQPSPKKEGQQCWVDISGTSTSRIIPRDGSLYLLVTCLQTPRRAKLLLDRQALVGTDFNCTSALQVDVYSASRYGAVPRNATLFAYRARCENKHKVNQKDNALAPLIPLGKKFVADSEWKTLKDINEYEYEMDYNHYRNHRYIWMLEARRPDCHVEIQFEEAADLSSVRIVEDYESHLEDLVNILDGGYVSVKSIRYLSCGRRVFIAGLFEATGKKTKYQYRQVCIGDNHAPTLQCSQDVTMAEPSLESSNWQTLQVVSPGNLNQLHQLHYHIPFPDGTQNSGTLNATSKVLELEFTSLVAAESWTGTLFYYRGSVPWAETHGVWLNDKIRAIVGKQYLFKTSVSIRLDSLLRTKKGDHLFTLRYRMVDAREVRREIRLGEVLTATSKARTLEFKIPPQFSTQQLHQILKKKRFEYEYEDHYRSHPSGDFPIWFFRHQYTIRPSNAKCRVVLRFTKMDIGSGYLLGRSMKYSNEQHRLSLMLNSNGTRRIPLTCASLVDEVQSMTSSNSNETLCARLDRTYVSAPGSTMALLFRSTDVGEYEYKDDGLAITGFGGPEVTFGSGWTATYQQLCDAAKVQALANIHLTSVVAKPVNRKQNWHQNLPGQLQSNDYHLFRDKRWIVTPQQAGCAVQYQVQYVKKTKKKLNEPIPLLFQVGNLIKMPRINKTFTTANVTMIQLGTSKEHPIVINYRQVCTRVPTASPTISPTLAPTVPFHSKVDGETCANERECASGMCSKILQRCTAKICAAVCSSKSSSQATCQAVVVVGCSCQWSDQTGSCVSIE